MEAECLSPQEPTWGSAALYVAAFVLVLRVLHRLYYLSRGHRHLGLSHRPRAATEAFLAHELDTRCSTHAFTTKHEGTAVSYRRIGAGPKPVLLLNGMGSDLHMWLRTLRCMRQQAPDLFQQVTLFVPSYRGLFEAQQPLLKQHVQQQMQLQRKEQPVVITLATCAEDVLELMGHAKVPQFHAILGWSTGAQVALHCCAAHPHVSRRLLLLNPSTGLTLHYFGQPLTPLPSASLRRLWGLALTHTAHTLTSLVDAEPVVWLALRLLVLSPLFRVALEALSFLGGCPPEQPAHFHEFMRDQFATPRQTKHLLALMLALDEAPPEAGFSGIMQDTVIVSGVPDFVTGVYHARWLAKQIHGCKHVPFSMASHFLLLEFPDLLAAEILRLVRKE